MKTSRMTAWFVVLCVFSWCRGGADEVPWGLYAITWEGPGQAMKRADDSEGQVFLGKQLTPKLRDAALVSLRNDNSLYRLTIAADEFPDGADTGQMAVVVAGLCVPVGSYRKGTPKGLDSMGGMVAGEAAAAKLADALGIRPRLREHPGHQLVVGVAPEKPTYHPKESVTLVMTIRNVGATTVRFYDGGSQRGPRNNQFGFTAFRNHGHGRAVSDSGDPMNFGGMMGQQTLTPGQTFTKSVELSDWFTFDTADSYLVTGMYQLQLHGEGSEDSRWDDVAVASCTVRVVDPPPTTKPAVSQQRS